MECDADGRGGAHPLQSYEGFGEAGMASLCGNIWCRLSSAWVGDDIDRGGGREGKSLLDVAGLFLVSFLVSLFNLPLVFLYACLEV